MSARRAAGFTLLEVLASVAILGLVYTMLSGVAARWLAAEGEARRRMQASLLADRTLAEIEAQVASGSVPAPGESESADEGEIYRVQTRVQDLSLPIELGQSEPAKRPAEAPTLFPTAPGAPTYLRRIDVVVAWDERGEPLEVQRTTVAFDLQAAAPVLAVIPRPDAEQGAGGGGEPDPDAAGAQGQSRQPSDSPTTPQSRRPPGRAQPPPQTQPEGEP